jgi:hypothetical protein
MQEFAEKLFKKLEGLTEKFEVKVMLLELVSRLMGRFIRIRNDFLRIRIRPVLSWIWNDFLRFRIRPVLSWIRNDFLRIRIRPVLPWIRNDLYGSGSGQCCPVSGMIFDGSGPCFGSYRIFF